MGIRTIAIVLLTFLCSLQVLGRYVEHNNGQHYSELEEKKFQAWFDHFIHKYESINVESADPSKHIQRIYKKTKKQTIVPSYPEQYYASFPIHPFFLNPHYQETIYTGYVPLQYNTATHLMPAPELVYPQEESHHRVLIPFSNPYPFLYGHSTVPGALKPYDYFTPIDTTHIPVAHPNIHNPYDDKIEHLPTINNNFGENGGQHAENNIDLQILKPTENPAHVGIDSNEEFNNHDKQKPIKDIKTDENTSSPSIIEIPLTPSSNIGSQEEENQVHSQVVAPSSEKPIPEETTVDNEDNKPNTTPDSKITENTPQDISSNEEQPSNIVEVNVPTPSPTSTKNTLEPIVPHVQTTQSAHDSTITEEINKLDVRFPIINIPSTANSVQNSITTEVPFTLKQDTTQTPNVEEKIPEITTQLSNNDNKYEVGVFLSTMSSVAKIQETTTPSSIFVSSPSVATKTTDQQDNSGTNKQRANDEDDTTSDDKSTTSSASITTTTSYPPSTSTAPTTITSTKTSSDSATSTTTPVLSTLTTSSTSSYQSPKTDYSATESSSFSTSSTTLPSTTLTRDVSSSVSHESNSARAVSLTTTEETTSISHESNSARTVSLTTTEETTSAPTSSSNQYYSTENFKSAETLRSSDPKKDVVSTSPSNKSTNESSSSSPKDAEQLLDDPDDSDDSDDSDDQVEQKSSDPTLSPECQSSRNSNSNDNSCYTKYVDGRSSVHSRLRPAKIPKLIIPKKIKVPKYIPPKTHPKLHIGRNSDDTEDRDEHNTELPENDEINTAKLYTTGSKQKTTDNHGTPEQIEMLLKKLTKYFKPEYGSQILTKQNSLRTVSKPDDKDFVIILPWILTESYKNLEQNKQLEINNYQATD